MRNSFTEPADRFVGAKSRLAAMSSFLTLGGVPLAAQAAALGAAATAKLSHGGATIIAAFREELRKRGKHSPRPGRA